MNVDAAAEKANELSGRSPLPPLRCRQKRRDPVGHWARKPDTPALCPGGYRPGGADGLMLPILPEGEGV
jgi:hypothetical protein